MLEKNSQTSHKPPSTDIVKPTKTKPKKKRKKGAQKGHQRHLRKPFPPEEVDTFISLHPGIENRPECDDRLVPSESPPIVTQQIEIPPKIINVTKSTNRPRLQEMQCIVLRAAARCGRGRRIVRAEFDGDRRLFQGPLPFVMHFDPGFVSRHARIRRFSRTPHEYRSESLSQPRRIAFGSRIEAPPMKRI